MKLDFTTLLKEKFDESVEEAMLDIDHMEDKIKDEDIWFIENQKTGMLIRRDKQEWTTIQGFCKNYGILNQKDFELMLRAMKRNKVRVVNTFKFHSSDELNLMTKDEWIDPKHIVSGSYKELTWAVLRSLSGGNDDALQHIMQWVGWKYLHPDDFMLPALSIYGTQNVGKGIFTNRILPTIFGGRQVFHAHGDDIIGSFNSHAVIGRSIVCVDESNLSKKTDDRLKQLIGNPKVQAHPKGLTPFEVDNCIAYVFTSNDLFGGMKLDSDVESNRRFSMIKVEKALPKWIAEFMLDWDELMRTDEVTKNFTDPVEIGKLLFDCIELAKALGRPMAYHGEDYKELVESQHPLNDFFADLFSTKVPATGVIATSEVYTMYREWYEANLPFPYTFSHTKLTQEAKKWALTHMPGMIVKKISISGKVANAFITLKV